MTQWMVEEGPDGAFLYNNPGYIATPEEVKLVVEELIRFAEGNVDFINDNNAKVDEFLESVRSGCHDDASKERSGRKRRYLYMFRSSESLYKIGVTTNVDRRLKELNDRPYPVELFAVSEAPFYNAFEAERVMHEIHDDCRVNGEWFKLSDDAARTTAIFVKSANVDYDYHEGD